MAGFSDSDDLASVDPSQVPPVTGVEGTASFLAWVDGSPAGAGTVTVVQGIAVLSGTAVLPRFRGRGLQKGLVAARLAWAHARGAREACSVTLPATASQASLERLGFRAAYPKLELVKGP
jgi:GNAT superfamily N-acetyltransferase